jgi:hypothetical protein
MSTSCTTNKAGLIWPSNDLCFSTQSKVSLQATSMELDLHLRASHIMDHKIIELAACIFGVPMQRMNQYLCDLAGPVAMQKQCCLHLLNLPSIREGSTLYACEKPGIDLNARALPR